jgi:hypothetical protein
VAGTVAIAVVEVGQAGQDRVRVDAEVEQVGDLVEAHLPQLVYQGQAGLGRAERAGRGEVPLEGVAEDGVHVLPGVSASRHAFR